MDSRRIGPIVSYQVLAPKGGGRGRHHRGAADETQRRQRRDAQVAPRRLPRADPASHRLLQEPREGERDQRKQTLKGRRGADRHRAQVRPY